MRSLKYSNRHKGGNIQHFLQYEITFDGIEIHDFLKNKIHTKLMFLCVFCFILFWYCLFVLFCFFVLFFWGRDGRVVGPYGYDYWWRGRVWRYQRGNQNPYIEEKQTTQWRKKPPKYSSRLGGKWLYSLLFRVESCLCEELVITPADVRLCVIIMTVIA